VGPVLAFTELAKLTPRGYWHVGELMGESLKARWRAGDWKRHGHVCLTVLPAAPLPLIQELLQLLLFGPLGVHLEDPSPLCGLGPIIRRTKLFEPGDHVLNRAVFIEHWGNRLPGLFVAGTCWSGGARVHRTARSGVARIHGTTWRSGGARILSLNLGSGAACIPRWHGHCGFHWVDITICKPHLHIPRVAH